ncbi:hypothetical protein V8F06_006248 [Rhypophila decipiens]
MFGSERRQVLESSRWRPTDEYQHLAACIETWDGDTDVTERPAVRRHYFANDDEIEDWISRVDQLGGSTQTRDPKQRLSSSGNHHGGIRLLLCERRRWSPAHIHFSMKESTFLFLENYFDLSEDTLPIIRLNGGQFISSIQHPGTTESSLSLVVKLPQMYQLGNHGLSLSHSFNTGITSAFVHGWNLITDQHEVTSEPMTPVMERIETLLVASVSSNPSSCINPLLLPTIILRDHVNQIQQFLTSKLSGEVEEIEYKLRVTKSARLAGQKKLLGEERRDDLEELKKLMANEQLRTDLTTDLNTTLTDTLNLLTVIKWDKRYCQFLLDLQERIRALNLGRASQSSPDDGLDSVLKYLDCNIESHIEYVETMIARLNLQLSVLYNLAAQTETDLTSRMTRAAVLDSSAMKTLALVTAVFLPPTFVATLFSMSMFDWQAGQASSSGASGQTVVPQFWIYWAISIPMTVLILLAWRIWWHFQKKSYERQFQKHVGAEGREKVSLMTRFNHWRFGSREE